VNHTIDTQFHGDFFIDSGQRGDAGLPDQVVEQMRQVPGVTAVLPVQLGDVKLAGSSDQLPGVDTGTVLQLGDLAVREGRVADLGTGDIAVSEAFAKDHHLHQGSTVPVGFLDGGTTRMRVGAIYHDADLMGPAFVSTASFDAHFAAHRVKQVYLKASGDKASVHAALDRIVASYPTAKVEDVAQFKADQTAGVNTLLGLIYVLLLLAVIIALLGIVNTLALSILERTHELGLMRAVGMSRRQTRSIIRWESVITALLGTFLGLVIGLFFGWSVVRALNSDGINQLSVPAGQLAVVVVLAGLAGVVAAILPARRAARLDILDAIATN
jgi:putative ABC transport system permease protein